MKIICPQCGISKKFYKICDGRLKCSACRKYFTPQKNLTIISRKIAKQVISEFILEHSTNTILDRVNIFQIQIVENIESV